MNFLISVDASCDSHCQCLGSCSEDYPVENEGFCDGEKCCCPVNKTGGNFASPYFMQVLNPLTSEFPFKYFRWIPVSGKLSKC